MSGGDPSLAHLPPTAPGGGDFGAPMASRTDTIDEANIGGPSRLKLKIQPSPPQYPYADTFFDLEVYMVDQHESLQRGEELPLNITLSHYVSNSPAAPGVLIVDPVSCAISKSGNCAVSIKIADDKASMERRRFRMKVEAVGRPDIEPAVTDKLTVIRNRLEIRENPDNLVPDQWYKDEGGRENCVELQVHLLGSTGEEVKSRRVPLRLVLMYENMHRVHNQEILKLSPDSKLVIDEHGKATLRVRIEEVSKNHQKQAFRIKVEPDVQEQPMSMDISSVVSKPITVLSKRINKPKKARTPPSNVKRSPVDPGYVPGMHLPDQMNLERRVNFNELISPSSGTVDTTNVSLYEALKSVIEWTGQVVNGLQTIQWQLLGYESKADGQPDHERPLYSMTNPNPVVNSIVRRYATDTMANLHVLLKRIEAGSFDDPSPGAGSGAGAGSSQSRASSPSTPVPGSVHGPVNGPPPAHSIGPAGVSSAGLGHQQQWDSPGSSMGSSGVRGGMAPRMSLSRERGDGRGTSGGGNSGGMSQMMVGSDGIGGAGGGGGNGAGGHQQQQQPSSKRAKISGGGSGAGSGSGSGGGSVGTGNGPTGSIGNGAGGGGGGNDERPNSPEQMEEAPPPIPSLNSGMSQMIVTRPGSSGAGGGGGDGAQRRFYNNQMSFGEGGNQGGGGGGQAPSLTRGPSLPAGLTDPTEVGVYFILAKGYLSHELGMLGFPAYDRNQLLLGFYKEVQSAGGQTQVIFIPAHRIQHLDERDTAATTEILREEMRKGSQSIISYDNCNGSLEKMREDAFMYYWSKSMIIDMGSNDAQEQSGAV